MAGEDRRFPTFKPDEVDLVGRSMRIDPAAESADPSLPAFIARPKGAPIYHGFPLIEETRTDGWCYGAVTEFEDPDGCDAGDGFVQAPDGSRAGIVWQVGDGQIETVLPPDHERWGVYSVWFPEPIRTLDDMIASFRSILPILQDIHAELKKQSG